MPAVSPLRTPAAAWQGAGARRVYGWRTGAHLQARNSTMSTTEKAMLSQLIARLDRADKNLIGTGQTIAQLDVLVVRNALADLAELHGEEGGAA